MTNEIILTLLHFFYFRNLVMGGLGPLTVISFKYFFVFDIFQLKGRVSSEVMFSILTILDFDLCVMLSVAIHYILTSCRGLFVSLTICKKFADVNSKLVKPVSSNVKLFVSREKREKFV